jgi:hypothetical protein
MHATNMLNIKGNIDHIYKTQIPVEAHTTVQAHFTDCKTKDKHKLTTQFTGSSSQF